MGNFKILFWQALNVRLGNEAQKDASFGELQRAYEVAWEAALQSIREERAIEAAQASDEYNENTCWNRG